MDEGERISLINERTVFKWHGEFWGTQQLLCLSLHWQSGFSHISYTWISWWGRGNENPPTINAEEVCDHLIRLNMYKPAGPDYVYSRVMKGLSDVVDKPLSYLKSYSCQEKSLVTGKRETSLPFWRNGEIKTQKLQTYRSLPLPGKIMKQILLRRDVKVHANKEVIQDIQNGFMKSCVWQIWCLSMTEWWHQ